MIQTYVMPVLKDGLNCKYFVFNDGTKSKTFYTAGELDVKTGEYPIFDKDNNLVEYMDLMGNFSKTETQLALDFYNYICTEQRVPFERHYPLSVIVNTGLVTFPSKHLVNEKVRKVVLKEEKRRYEMMCKNAEFASLFERISYKLYAKKIRNIKLKKADMLKAKLEAQNKSCDIEIKTMPM